MTYNLWHGSWDMASFQKSSVSSWQLEMRNYLLLEKVLSVLQSPHVALPLLLTLLVIRGLQVANEILQTQAHCGD